MRMSTGPIWRCGDETGVLTEELRALGDEHAEDVDSLSPILKACGLETEDLRHVKWPFIGTIYLVKVPESKALDHWHTCDKIEDRSNFQAFLLDDQGLEETVSNLTHLLQPDLQLEGYEPKTERDERTLTSGVLDAIASKLPPGLGFLTKSMETLLLFEPWKPIRIETGEIKPTTDDLVEMARGFDTQEFVRQSISSADARTLKTISEPDQGPFSLPRQFDPALIGELYLAFIKANANWELPARLLYEHNGPPPYVHSAMALRWFKRFGAKVIFAAGERAFMHVGKPPVTVSEAAELAREHLAYSPDTVNSSGADYTTSLIGNPYWEFFFD